MFDGGSSCEKILYYSVSCVVLEPSLPLSLQQNQANERILRHIFCASSFCMLVADRSCEFGFPGLERLVSLNEVKSPKERLTSSSHGHSRYQNYNQTQLYHRDFEYLFYVKMYSCLDFYLLCPHTESIL